MNRHVNAIAGRLSLRPPQRRSLEILDRIAEIVPPRKGTDIEAALAAIRTEFGSIIPDGNSGFTGTTVFRLWHALKLGYYPRCYQVPADALNKRPKPLKNLVGPPGLEPRTNGL